MTYCVAWKSNEEVYIIADSLTSSRYKDAFDNESPFSSMGESYGEYDNNYIGETDTKIYFQDNIVVAFSGVIDIFPDIKEKIMLLGHNTCVDIIMNNLQEVVGDADLIVGIKTEENNKLYHLNKLEYIEVDDFIAVGSGSDITDLNNLMKEFSCMDTDPDYEPRKKISAAVAYIQMLSLKNNYLKHGVGGTFCGVYIDSEIEWNDDFLYFLYDEAFEKKSLINVIVRKGTLLTGSDFTGLTKLFKYESLSEDELRKMLRFMHKCIASYIPRYVIFYSFEMNNIYFCDIYNQTHTVFLKIFQRRGKIESKVEVYTSPYLNENYLMKNKNDENMIIPFNYLDMFSVPYIPRDKLLDNVENIFDVDYTYDNFDFPLENVAAPIEVGKLLKSEISQYENILIVNAEYLESKIRELSEFYNGINIDFDYSKILKGICNKLKEDRGVKGFKVLFFTDREQLASNLLDDTEIYINKSNYNFKSFTLSILLEYYKNPLYYHMDKIVILNDSADFNILFEVLPDYNRILNEADIFLIKNQNFESEVLYSPYYYNADTLIPSVVGLPNEAYGLWYPQGMSEDEKAGIAYYLNSQIDNS